MPNKDGTGPLGKGPRTGRQLGNCKGAEPQPGIGPKRGTKRCHERRCRGSDNKRE